MAKGLEVLAHTVTLLEAENRTLRDANKALGKRRRSKKTRIRNGGTLAIREAIDLLEDKEVDAQLQRNLRNNGVAEGRGRGGPRRCGRCHNVGHNSRTCQIAVSVSSKSDYE